MKIQIIMGSTRPGRNSEGVAKWVNNVLSGSDLAEFELLDIADYHLPLLDEAAPPQMRMYSKDHTKQWSEKISEADGYIFVSPEYNHSVPGAFKNAVDFLYREWNNKSVGFVSYGSNGGSRAVEHWRSIAAELQMADVREQLLLSLAQDFENFTDFKPSERHERQLLKVAGQVVSWAGALKTIKEPVAV